MASNASDSSIVSLGTMLSSSYEHIRGEAYLRKRRLEYSSRFLGLDRQLTSVSSRLITHDPQAFALFYSSPSALVHADYALLI